jgi:hypothetical protein
MNSSEQFNYETNSSSETSPKAVEGVESANQELKRENTPDSTSPIDREAIQKRDDDRLANVRALLGLPISALKKAGEKVKEWLNKETLPESNILYRPDRMYRCIGELGYQDFLETGTVRSKNRRLYVDTSFNEGAPSSVYIKGASGAYILEALSDATVFSYKTHPFNGKPMKDISYRSTENGALTNESAIRIFERIKDGEYKIVFDNIGDQALVDDTKE